MDLREARPDDAEAIANIYLRSRKELVGCAPLVHSDGAVREWVRQRLIPSGGVTVAVASDQIVGFLAVSRTLECAWVDQLYVLPEWVGRGAGSQLLEVARRTLLPPIRLYTFQANRLAASFYERRGFRAIAVSDGSDNEERCPDILYEWKPD